MASCSMQRLAYAAVQEIRDILSRVDELSAAELGEQLQKYDVKAPETNNDISKPFPFNLMFKTSIGPRGDNIGYMRPETAQGIFVNFKWAPCPALHGCCCWWQTSVMQQIQL